MRIRSGGFGLLLCVASGLAVAQTSREPPRSGGSMVDRMVRSATKWDYNNDQVFTCEEWKKYATDLFNKADRNHDGFVDAQEFKMIQDADQQFKESEIGYFDDNRDGRLSRSEFVDKPNPFFLRFDWEMNGDWFPWDERIAGNRPGEFAAAWRHVHEIFAAVGATNVAWVWCPAADPYHTEQPLAGLYPGDRYVDWTCLDVYNFGRPWQTFDHVIASSYDQVVRIAPDKPMILGEVASSEHGGDKAAWVREMFAALPTRYPLVRGLVWFDSTPGSGIQHSDPLDSSRAATAAFAAGIDSPRFATNRFATLHGAIPVP